MHSTSTANPRAQGELQQMLEALVATGQETGIQAAAYLDGQLVVDAWAGAADPESGRPIDGDTLINVWSAGKAVAATTIHALVERGTLEYDAPLARYWPEFGFAVAIAKNRMTQAWPGAVEAAVREALGLPTVPSDSPRDAS